MKIKKILLSTLLIINYTSTAFSQQLEGKNPQEKVLDHSNTTTDLYITGALTPMGLARIGKPLSVIPHKDLQERSEPTIGELLSSEPGVSSSYFGPGASRPVIRGQSKERVRVIENGLEVGDVSQVSDDHGVAVDPLSLQRIDVLRGPSTLLYGSSAIGGVVNMIDQSIAEQNIERAITGELDLRKGDSADEETSAATSLNGQAGEVNWHFSGYYRDTDDIEIPGFAESERFRELESDEENSEHSEDEEEVKDFLPNSATLSKGLKTGVSHVWENGFLGLALRINNSKYGIPGEHHHEEEHSDEHDDDEHDHEEHAEEGEEGVRIDLDQIRLESRGEIKFDHDFFKALRFGASYSDYNHKELEGDAIGTKFDKDAFEARAELTHKHSDDFEGGLGTQIKYEDFKAQGEEAFVPPSETFSPALFAVEDYKINPKLVLQLGGRYEFTNISPELLSSEDFHAVSFSTGLVKNLDDNNIYTLGLTAAYSERAPSSSELFANGGHLATQTFEIGDPNLDKENSVGTELVFRKNSGRITGSTSLFWQHYFDYINLTPNGEEIDDLSVFNYSIDRARFWGFEAESDILIYANENYGINLYSQIDYVRGDNLSDNDPLPRITPMRGKVGLRYKYENFGSYIETILVNEQDKTADFELPTDSYALLNAGLSYQIAKDTRNTYELYARATNLTDEEARIHNSFLKDVAPLRGRALLAGISVNF